MPEKIALNTDQLGGSGPHFTSSHELFVGNEFQIEGLADTSVLDDLTPADAVAALQLAENMMRVLLRHRGVAEARLPAALHSWTGLPPKPPSPTL